jgi:hypothetical protein
MARTTILAGRILNSEDGEKLACGGKPALAEDGDVLGRQSGEAINPERYPAEEFYSIKAVLGSWAFEALFSSANASRRGRECSNGEWFSKFVRGFTGAGRGAVRLVALWDKAATAG